MNIMVVKRSKREHGIAYTTCFSLVPKLDKIRMIIALTAHNTWSLFQLDIKSIFLYAEFDEHVYIVQLPGFVVKGREDNVYTFKKISLWLKTGL